MMIRMDQATHARLKAIAEANGLSTSDLVRLSVHRQLPALNAGQTRLLPS